MRFNSTYFFGFLVLLVIEICIALFVNDRIIRPFIGDVLVVGLIYFFVSSFLLNRQEGAQRTPIPRILGVVLFAFIIETLQATNILEWLHLEHNKFARIVFGSVFDVFDLLAYSCGGLLILLWEHYRFKRSRSL